MCIGGWGPLVKTRITFAGGGRPWTIETLLTLTFLNTLTYTEEGLLITVSCEPSGYWWLKAMFAYCPSGSAWLFVCRWGRDVLQQSSGHTDAVRTRTRSRFRNVVESRDRLPRPWAQRRPRGPGGGACAGPSRPRGRCLGLCGAPL